CGALPRRLHRDASGGSQRRDLELATAAEAGHPRADADRQRSRAQVGSGTVRKLWNIPGGIHPPEHKAQSLQKPLGELPLPPQLIRPVSKSRGAPEEAVVSVGDKVPKGQLSAVGSKTISANVHASTSGSIAAIEERPLPHPSGLNGLCIVLNAD